MPALAQPKSAARFEVVRTEGCRVFAADGRSAIDFQSGWCVGNLGWSRPEIERALREFDGPAYVYPNHRYGPWEELAEGLVGIAPPPRWKASTSWSAARRPDRSYAIFQTPRFTGEDAYA